MEKVVVRVTSLSQALVDLALAGCKIVEVSVLAHAVKVDGAKEDGTRFPLHVWSKDAEDMEADVGKGERKLTEEEVVFLNRGLCPICEGHGQLYKEEGSGLAIGVSCDVGHTFWIPRPPMLPEYLGQHKEEKE